MPALRVKRPQVISHELGVATCAHLSGPTAMPRRAGTPKALNRTSATPLAQSLHCFDAPQEGFFKTSGA
jgi:hypothetical protein